MNKKQEKSPCRLLYIWHPTLGRGFPKPDGVPFHEWNLLGSRWQSYSFPTDVKVVESRCH